MASGSEGRSADNFKLQIFCVLYLQPQHGQFTLKSTAIPLLFHVVPVTTEALITQLDEHFGSQLPPFRVLCHPPSCHECFHLAVVFKSVSAMTVLQSRKQMTNARRRIPLV